MIVGDYNAGGVRMIEKSDIPFDCIQLFPRRKGNIKIDGVVARDLITEVSVIESLEDSDHWPYLV